MSTDQNEIAWQKLLLLCWPEKDAATIERKRPVVAIHSSPRYGWLVACGNNIVAALAMATGFSNGKAERVISRLDHDEWQKLALALNDGNGEIVAQIVGLKFLDC